MEQPEITFIINGNTYRVCASRPETLRNLPSADRQQLIRLLEKIKLEDQKAKAAVQQALVKAKMPSGQARKTPTNAGAGAKNNPKPERLGSGDVDALMAKLILEEKQHQKPTITKQSIYKWLAVFIVVFLVLMFIF